MITSRKIFLQFVILFTLLQTNPVMATSGRALNVKIQNLTGLEIEAVTLVHKYSNNYKDIKTWNNIPNGRIAPGVLKARFHTGAFTTGQDWWFVTWKYKNNNSLQYTSPNNFRGFIDALESLPLALFNIHGQLSPAPSLTEKMARTVINRESTKGFKSYILRAEDVPSGLVITITNQSVKFDSVSGHASIDTIKTKLLPEEKVVKTHTQNQTPQRVAIRKTTCQNMIQDKIAWDDKGRKHWNPRNIKKLCGASSNTQPAVCFKGVMHGGYQLVGGDKWGYVSAINLCKNSSNTGKTIQCFNRTRQIMNQNEAINKCTNRRVSRPVPSVRAVDPTAVPPKARRAPRD